MKRKDHKSQWVPVGRVIRNVLKTYRHEPDQELTRIWDLWEAVVGPVIAENVQPAAFKGNLLVLEASSSAWIQQLHFLKKELIAKINHAMGKEMVSEIKFKIGTFS